MKANLSVILERWAELYDAIGHNRKSKDGKKEKAFYLIRAINEDNEFVRNQNTAKSPCVAYSILIDAEGTNNLVVNYEHTIYFLMRSKQTSLAKSARQDDEQFMNVQMAMDEFVQDLLAYLARLKHTGKCPITGQTYDAATMQALAGLQLDKANWLSLATKYSGWNVLALAIEQNQPRNLNCINTDQYTVPTADPATTQQPSDSGTDSNTGTDAGNP